MAKRNHRTNIIELQCPACGNPTGRAAASSHARFKANRAHIDNEPCDACDKRIKGMAAMLEAGGTMIVCTNCQAVTVTDNIPEVLQSHVVQMPDGIKRLNITKCPCCKPEAKDVPTTETQGPELGT